MAAIRDQIRAFANFKQRGSKFLLHQGSGGVCVEVFEFNFEQNSFDLQEKGDQFLRIGLGVDVGEQVYRGALRYWAEADVSVLRNGCGITAA
jgi:hypothetical protein